jgi:hypothetical protein
MIGVARILARPPVLHAMRRSGAALHTLRAKKPKKINARQAQQRSGSTAEATADAGLPWCVAASTASWRRAASTA